MPTNITNAVSTTANAVSTVSDTVNNDWRDGVDPSDLLYAMNSYYSKEDFSGRAAIYESATATKPLNIDLIVTNVDLNLDEHIQVSEHIGDTFGIICFGKAPLQVTYSCILPDTQRTYGKQYLIDAYKNKLRLTAVARTGNIPVMQFATHAIKGPFISLRVTERSSSEDTLIVIMTMFVTELKVV